MLQLLIIAALFVAGMTVLGWLKRTNRTTLTAAMLRTKWIGIGIGTIGLVGLILTKNPGFLVGLLGFLAPVIIQMLRQVQAGRTLGDGWGAPGSAGQRSEIATLWLRLTLDHASGDMQGRVLAGRFAGRLLGDLELPELVALLAECAGDADSARLLESYLDRRFGPEWRRANAGGSGARGPSRTRDTDMSVAEAWEVLGLKPGAGADQIRAAHRRLMQSVHPDRGGSDHLAARVNRAKDILLADER